VAEIKFCGLTRAEDTAVAYELAARYAGVIFAGGPRLITAERAREVFEPLRGTDIGRVGVFGSQDADEVARTAHAARVDVVQLHGGGTPEDVRRLRPLFGGGIWVVLRVPAGAGLPASAREVAAEADAVLLDAAAPGQLGGTGVALDWAALSEDVKRLRDGGSRVVLAGGLRAENVAAAIRLLRPDVVDVSSGVESAPGIKDHDRMRAFADAARAATDEE
jgi:phosphoribosylanthranilate isomerase